jgi:hypothetical protein
MLGVYERAMSRPLSENATGTRNAQRFPSRDAHEAIASRPEAADAWRHGT